MGIENFIKDALHKPHDYVAYHVGRELAEPHPGKAILEGETGYFDLEAFVRAEQCSVVHETSVFNHIKTDWDGPGKEPKQSVVNSWLNVLWCGHLLDVVLVTYKHTVKALVNQLGQSCLYVKSFKSEYETDQANLAAVFARTRMTTPCLVVLEDLDSMIDDKSRACFLNELDGFETNTGVVILATTNHPERLDPAILDRPSRFDRKYYFDLPAEAERAAYLKFWNQELAPELRVSEITATEVVQRTKDFSFAYLKELFLSAMMQWMTKAGSISMDEIILGQAIQLRGQMAHELKATR
jgi:ATPase family associated with various cellular activities (AAA)